VQAGRDIRSVKGFTYQANITWIILNQQNIHSICRCRGRF
jgi:hypothetical protein